MTEQTLSRYKDPNIKKAAELYLKCAGFLNDQDDAMRNDHRYRYTYYAIDTDVITLYIEPLKKTGYLDIFIEDQNSPTSKSLAFLLGDFLIASSEPLVEGHGKQSCRFLVIPPHDEELLRLLTAIHRQLNDIPMAVSETAFRTLSDAFMQYDEDQDEDTLLNTLKTNVSDLVELFNPYLGPKAALGRFAKLAENTFQGIETYREGNFSFQPIYDDRDRAAANELIGRWKVRLKEAAPSNKPLYALERDAVVLATIEYVNKDLHDDKKQIVLITGSNSLFIAAGKYVPTWHPDNQNKQSFADLYLRHPQAFMAHSKFFPYFHEFEKEPFKLFDWLNLFFPGGWPVELQSKGIIDRQFLRSIQAEGSPKYNGVIHALDDVKESPIAGLINTWRAKVASLAESRYSKGLEKAEERGAADLAEKLRQLRETREWTVEGLRRLMFAVSLEATSALFSKTVWVGLWSQITRLQSKGVPVLRFDYPEFGQIDEYCNRVVKLQLESVNKKISTEKLRELYAFSKKVEDEDQSFYHAHIVHALAFATKGHWYAALTLAKMAMAIADNIHNIKTEVRGREKIRGREAAYIACIATRRSARDRSALRTAADYIDEAIKRENPDSLAEDIRFTEERLGLDTRKYYFDFFCDSKRPDDHVLLSVIENLFRLAHLVAAEANQLIRMWVYRQMFTNLFSLLLITRKLGIVGRLSHPNDIIKFLQIFESVINNVAVHSHKQEDEPYTHLIFHVAMAAWGSSSEKKKAHIEDALIALNKWDAFYMPYDAKRIEFLKQIVLELQSKNVRK